MKSKRKGEKVSMLSRSNCGQKWLRLGKASFFTWEENSVAENSDVLSQRCKEDMVLVEEDAKVEAHSGMSERRRP